MTSEHLDRAIRESCPFMRLGCVIAHVGGCAAVMSWGTKHRSEDQTNFSLQSETVSQMLSRARFQRGHKKQRSRSFWAGFPV